MPRLFTAIDFPSDIREELANICHGVNHAKWLPLVQLHCTLQFIGDVEADQYHRIVEALGEVRADAFEVQIHGVGHFPPRKPPRILWAGLDPSDGLIALNDQVELALMECNIEPEDRKFHPHVTLARLRERVSIDEAAEFLVTNALFRASRPVPIDEFHLYSSVLSSDGAVHYLEKSYSLE